MAQRYYGMSANHFRIAQDPRLDYQYCGAAPPHAPAVFRFRLPSIGNCRDLAY
jgi:hypothetical protein